MSHLHHSTCTRYSTKMSARNGQICVETLPSLNHAARGQVQRKSTTSAASSMNGNGYSSNGNGASSNGRYSSTPTAVGTLVEEEVVFSPEQVFNCPEESLFYSQCLQRVLGGGMMTRAADGGDSGPPLLVEFGAGDGSPVIDALIKTGPKFKGRVHGFELNPRAASLARSRCNQLGLNGKYHVHHSCFFKGAEELKNDASWLVANPPYIPAPDSDILMPELHGGVDGATLTNKLLSLGYPNAMLLVSSYSNPLSTIQYAKELGYIVTDFLVTPLPFGYYSSEPKVKNWIRKMKGKGQAYFSERPALGSNGWYLLAGVLFQKVRKGETATPLEPDVAATADASEELIRVLTAL